MPRALFFSTLIHIGIIFLISGFMFDIFPPEKPQIMQVRLVNAKKVLNPIDKQLAPKAKKEDIKTQASAAPKEAPKETSKAKPNKSKIPKVKVSSKKKLKVKKDEIKKKEAKKQVKEAKKRPPKLDKTPDKKRALKSKNKKAKTVANADDFLSTLDFINKLEEKQLPSPKNVVETTDDDVKLTIADASDLAKLKKHIEKNWLVPPGIKDMDEFSITVEVRLKPDGKLSNLKLTKSSGHAFFDNSLLRAVRKSVPFAIPPKKYEIFKVMELNFGG